MQHAFGNQADGWRVEGQNFIFRSEQKEEDTDLVVPSELKWKWRLKNMRDERMETRMRRRAENWK